MRIRAHPTGYPITPPLEDVEIADGAVTNAKIAPGISPDKIGTGDLNLGTGTLTAGMVSVGDLSMQYGWRIIETPDALLFVKDDEIVGQVTKAGFISLKKE